MKTREQVTKIKYKKASEAVVAFENGKPLYTNVSSETFTRIDNAELVLRYFYRLYELKDRDQPHNTNHR